MIEMIIQIILLIVGFLFLIKGADYFVDGASSIANVLKIPTLIIGLTVVAFGTSAPEAAVSVAAALSGSNAIAISNVVGSNIFNILLILGLCSLVATMKVDPKLVKQDLPFLLLTSILLTGAVFLTWQISRLLALIFLILIIAYVVYLVYNARKSEEAKFVEKPKYSLILSIVIVIVSLIAIVLGAQLVVNSAKFIALSLGMSETLIGLTIISIGTSLPELITSLTAVKKGENNIAIGNIVGSCLFNILFILGLSGFIHPITVGHDMIVDLCVMILATVLLYVFSYLDEKLDKKEGIIFLIFFIIYMAFIIMRN
ncbi:calcium/sodium antiporter [Methanobrevibacter acididurans]|uniref:calcium/sodium antiporter n=1 Tax=Methanobrevibacter acididurans TaxID=120963 RepID=UPI0038FCEEF9